MTVHNYILMSTVRQRNLAMIKNLNHLDPRLIRKALWHARNLPEGFGEILAQVIIACQIQAPVLLLTPLGPITIRPIRRIRR
ncbi:hypothetical protein GF380_01610 [Candidatus Uhrbacteria bacterium]|nr:hypothetical protein [Candidatus Uhrbacteria bacterium]